MRAEVIDMRICGEDEEDPYESNDKEDTVEGEMPNLKMYFSGTGVLASNSHKDFNSHSLLDVYPKRIRV